MPREKYSEVRIFVSRQSDGDEYPFEGHLDYINLDVEESTGTYPIRGIINNPERRLYPGMFVKVRVAARGEPYIGAIGDPKAGNAVVVKVEEHSPAEEAGIKPGDVIVELGGQTISNFASLTSALGKQTAGDKVKVKVRRGQQVMELALTMGRKKSLLVPERCIGTDQEGRYVLVVNDKDIVERRSVEVEGAPRFKGMQVVRGGLTRDDRVIIRGLQRARIDGKVKPTEEVLPKLEDDGAQELAGGDADSVSVITPGGDADGNPVRPPKPQDLDASASAIFGEDD